MQGNCFPGERHDSCSIWWKHCSTCINRNRWCETSDGWVTQAQWDSGQRSCPARASWIMGIYQKLGSCLEETCTKHNNSEQNCRHWDDKWLDIEFFSIVFTTTNNKDDIHWCLTFFIPKSLNELQSYCFENYFIWLKNKYSCFVKPLNGFEQSEPFFSKKDKRTRIKQVTELQKHNQGYWRNFCQFWLLS